METMTLQKFPYYNHLEPYLSCLQKNVWWNNYHRYNTVLEKVSMIWYSGTDCLIVHWPNYSIWYRNFINMKKVLLYKVWCSSMIRTCVLQIRISFNWIVCNSCCRLWKIAFIRNIQRQHNWYEKNLTYQWSFKK